VIGRAENIEQLRQHGSIIIHLNASFEQIARRLAEEQNDRPLFRDSEQAEKLYLSRLPIYRAVADLEIITDTKTPEEIAAEARNRIAEFERARSSHISGHTALTLIIGDPVSHSLSPRMHNAGYVARGLPFVMAASHVSPSNLEEAIVGVRALKIRGLAVTMPHKITIMSYLDTIDPIAREIGAVNTVVNTGGTLTGYNTDWRGIVDPLSQLIDLKGTRVAVLGAGGAAQAAIYGCISAGADVTIFNRTAERGSSLAERWGCHATSLNDEAALRSSAVIINTTSVGMQDTIDQSPISCDALHPEQVLFETIYAPRTTTLVAAALERGARVIRGIEMFIAQGVAQFELHTGYKPPYERMRQVVLHQ
jgi:shikimate dehydrogenase